MNIYKFEPVTKENLWKVVALDAGDDEKYVKLNSHTLLEAIFNHNLGSVLVLYRNSILIGLAYYEIDEGSDYDVCWIERFMIDKKYQGKGYGTKVFQKLLQHLKKMQINKFLLLTSNPVAEKMYAKFGFQRVVSKEAEKYYDEYQEYLMELIV